MKKILLLFLLCYSAGAHAQHSKTEMERFLTNGELRTWIYKNYKVTLGTSCSGDGQSFDFYKKGSLVIWKRCLDGVPRVDSLKWQIGTSDGNRCCRGDWPRLGGRQTLRRGGDREQARNHHYCHSKFSHGFTLV